MNTKLGRKKDHRELMTKNILASLVVNERIVTTAAKARLVKSKFDRFITKAKPSKSHELISIKERLSDRKSGMLKTYKLGRRVTDGSEMVLLEIICAKPIGKVKTRIKAGKDEKQIV